MSTSTPAVTETSAPPSTTASHRALFIEKRRAFKENPHSNAELEAYERRDDTYNYTVLKGLIPPPLVGKTTPGGQSQWHKSDTFFTDFKRNYPEQVLSESESSLVIGNTASHDTRQYLAEWDPHGKDKTPSAGMSYIHLLVIPKRRIYNAVCMADTTIIDEMLEHFESFWQRPDSLDKTTIWLKTAVENRTKTARQCLESKGKTSILSDFDSTMQDVRASADKFDHDIRQLLASSPKRPVSDLFDFFFHPAPDASIAHLHLHCVLNPASTLSKDQSGDCNFRQFSTYAHDWKSIPVDIVKDVIRCDNELRMQAHKHYHSVSDRVLTALQGVVVRWISGWH